MDELPIKANICEVDSGIYYRAVLLAVPRVGELIELFSHIEQADGQPPHKHYEVVQVMHLINDVADHDSPAPSGSRQFVNVYVKLSNSAYFKT